MMHWVKYILIAVGFLSHIDNIYTQSGFSKTYSLNAYPTVLTDVETHNGNIYVMGLMVDTTNVYHDVNIVLKLDLNGNIVDTVYKELNDNYIFTTKGLVYKADNEFVTIGNLNNALRGIVYHYKNDTLFDSLTTTFNSSMVFGFKSILNHSDMHYYLFCIEQDIDYDGNIVIIKLDSMLNEVWRYKYGVFGVSEGATIYPGTIVELNDGNLLIGSNKSNMNYTVGNNPVLCPTYFLKIDTGGNVLQQWTNPDNMSWTPGQVAQTIDGKYIYSGSYVDYYDVVGNTFLKAYVCKRDASFNLEWEHKLSTLPSGITVLHDLVLKDDKIFTVGNEYDSILNDSRAVLYCFDTTGYMLYKRYFNTPPPLSSIGWNDTPFFYSIDIPDDSTIIMAGQIIISTPPPLPVQYGWVVKTNIYGCLLDTGSFHYAGINQMGMEDVDILLYPNPIQAELQFRVSSNVLGSKFLISNIQGQVIQDGVLEAPLTIFDVANLPTGVYAISIYGINYSGSIKFIKN